MNNEKQQQQVNSGVDVIGESEGIQVYEAFEDMTLEDKLLRGIFSYGYEKPSAIQKRAIVPFIQKHDLIAQAQSGTGKTATFGIGVLSRIDPLKREIQAIILSPTRELSKQTYDVITGLAEFMDIRVAHCVGGVRLRDNIREIEEMRPQIIIGTAGRINDFIQKGVIATSSIVTFVLDEADEMLSRGFADQIYDIFVTIPKEAQVALFSATLPHEALEMTKKFMVNPLCILVKKEAITLAGIKQYYVYTEREEWKFDTLCDLYDSLNLCQTIIFCNSKRKVMWLAERLREKDFTVSLIHGDMEQQERVRVMDHFRSGQTRTLLSTDILARGIDVPSVSMVVNYDIPRSELGVENYIHRIGRCGRYGKKGVTINFVNAEDKDAMKHLEEFYQTHIEELPNDISNLLST